MSLRRPWLLPLLPLYAAGLRLKELTRRAPGRLRLPVVSIGSISAGGAGKTPMTLLLIDLLRRQGFAPIVLTRGYKREGEGVERVEARGFRDGSAAHFGDEPVLLARRGRAPVYVGNDRHAAGVILSPQAEPNTVFVLDDGFQHRNLAREIDIILLTQQDADDFLLPAGNLREPLSALRRADVIVLREEEATQLRPLLARWPRTPVWVVRRSLSFSATIPQRPLAFCGIARPEGFLTMLGAVGCQTAGQVFFDDHHAYKEEDLDKIFQAGLQCGADSLVTTEKDAVKLTANMRDKLNRFLPLSVAELQLELVDEDQAITMLLERLRR